MNTPCSMIRNLEQRVYYGIKFGDYKNEWNLLKIRKSSKILTHRAVLAVPTFRFPVPKSLAAIPECSEIHERIWVFPKALLIVNLPDECLENYIMIQETGARNLAASSGIQRREGIEKSGSEKPLQPIHLLCFSGKAKEKSLDDSNCLKSMTHHTAGIGTLLLKVASQFRVILPRRCIWKNSPIIRNFRAGL